MPARADMGYVMTLGVFHPIGGVGPFSYSFDSLGTKYAGDAMGHLRLNYNAVGTTTDVLNVTCTDGTGAQATSALTIAKTTDLTPTIILSQDGFNDNASRDSQLFGLRSWGGDHSWPNDVYTATDPSGQWGFSYGGLAPLTGMPVQPGSYPIAMTARSQTITTSITATITIMPFVPPGIPIIVFSPTALSTITPQGFVVGVAACTTPHNAPVFTIGGNDARYFSIDPTTRQIKVIRALPLGNLNITLTVVDGLTSSSAAFLINVLQGVTIAATNMTLTAPVGLNNFIRNQPIGTPIVTGLPAGTLSWTLTFPEFYTGSYMPLPLFMIDASTGTIRSIGQLSAMSAADSTSNVYSLKVTAQVGTTSCTNVFPITVGWAPPGPDIYVGPGMLAAHGANGFEHVSDIVPIVCRQDLNGGAWVNAHIIFNDGGNRAWFQDFPSLYASKPGWCGPLRVSNTSPTGPRVRVGGIEGAGTAPGTPEGKAFWLVGHGDQIYSGFEVSDIAGPLDAGGNTHGISGFRKDGDTYGGLEVFNCYFQACNNGIETGAGPGLVHLHHNVFANCGTAYISSGACHNVYIGACSFLEFHNNLSMNSAAGILLKCRARAGHVYNNRFVDTERGLSINALDFPDGGTYLIENNRIQQAGNVTGDCMIKVLEQYSSDILPPPWGGPGTVPPRITNVTVRNNEISNCVPAGTHSGPHAVLNMNTTISSVDGSTSSVTFTNNTLYLAPGSIYFHEYMYYGTYIPGSPNVTETGTTYLTVPTPLDLSDPGTANPPYARPGFKNYTLDNLSPGSEYQNFTCVQIDPGNDDMAVALAAALPLTLGTLSSYGANIFKQISPSDPGIQPFGPGSVWSIVQDGQWGGQQPWAPVGRYTTTPTDASGNSTLVVNSKPAVAGVDFIKVRCVGPRGTICDYRFYIAFR